MVQYMVHANVRLDQWIKGIVLFFGLAVTTAGSATAQSAGPSDQLSLIHSSWTRDQLDAANTAKDAKALSEQEREAILYINLCRLYPKEFAEKEVLNYHLAEDYEDSYIREFEQYRKSLLRELANRKPCAALVLDKRLQNDAECYAAEISVNKRAPHQRKDCPPSNSAECVSFGQDLGIDVAFQWLVDSGIRSLGHRRICLDESIVRIGLSMNSHFEWEFCAVAEFQ